MDDTIKVYVKVNSDNAIIDINSSIFLDNFTDWIKIDEGTGDKYALAQNNYLDKGLIDSNRKYNYKLVDGKVLEITDDEKITLDEVKENKMNELDTKCNELITSGFNSSADGTSKLYDFKLENQLNLESLKNNVLIQQLQNKTVDSVSYYAKGESCHDYTASQFLQLTQDAQDFKTDKIKRYKELKTYIETLTTKDAVKAVTWDTTIPTTTK